MSNSNLSCRPRLIYIATLSYRMAPSLDCLLWGDLFQQWY